MYTFRRQIFRLLGQNYCPGIFLCLKRAHSLWVMKGPLQRMHTVGSSKISTLERKIKCWDIQDEIISFYVQRSKVLMISAWKDNLYISCSLCIFCLCQQLPGVAESEDTIKLICLYSRGFERLQCTLIYSARGNSVRQWEAKSGQLLWRTSFGEPWVLPANAGSEKSSLEPRYHPKDKKKQVFLTQTCFQRRVGFKLPR